MVGSAATGAALSFSERDLERFREVQQLAYRCAEETAQWLEPGVTERQAADELRRRLIAGGVEDFFHVPFAWFGDRTAFRNFRVPFQFFPGNRQLREGMPFVLDCAPIVDGYTADIGYGGVIGANRVWQRLCADLREYRDFILRQVRQGHTLDEIYKRVDELIDRHGFCNRHQVYPGRVIGHQVTRQHAIGPKGVTVFGFGIRTLQTLGRELITERLHGRSPLWADKRASAHAPTPGLWAVEPHIAFRDVGIKFEELLVVTGDPGNPAYWLDDDLPHVRRWQRMEDA
ncbi:M24 family metallopeptidase [Haloechinothrix sp. LS1_15]|uniref:M24 family metallopeptidase n=1 Tax=Haloechinothrix sp. LS1_15 TaxID=2652248 RepID=UPI0029477853|nr:M24 family metallopeptidase [Haloechinothrix sp. LS1_15]MDV6011221.1 aminopeptidase P family protein [Haloechinothrix sp. LS1_15]